MRVCYTNYIPATRSATTVVQCDQFHLTFANSNDFAISGDDFYLLDWNIFGKHFVF